MQLKDYLGQEKIIASLKQAVDNNELSHAYLFVGPEGSGKRTLADIFAKMVLCKGEGEKPCELCNACLTVDAGSNFDVIDVVAEKLRLNPKGSKTISVDDIRERVTASVSIKPNGDKKIYILDGAEKMDAKAQNALLKTLEEPPEYVIIILISSSKEAMLQTIMSRVLCYEFKPVETARIENYLVNKKQIPSHIARMSARFSQGVVGEAILFALSDEFEEERKKVVELVSKIDRMTAEDILSYASVYKASSTAKKEEKDDGEKPKRGAKTAEKAERRELRSRTDDFLDLLELFFRDIFVYKGSENDELISFSDDLMIVREVAEEKSAEAIAHILDAIREAKARIKANLPMDGVMEMLLLKMRER
ncbi:MAG: hypothetical protein MJ113_00115 [Lachnospiraceae bacterium]|nr:hypothetical protein [Lachnospiraceae bacterium]